MAETLKKPRWFISHNYVTFARKLLQPYRFIGKVPNPDFKFIKTSVLDSDKVIDMYEDINQTGPRDFLN